ncbi:hypothetical protein MMMB2_2484 [Mycobacterium marinum MB2]|nr:hypothetical protein MMMB2_2484 [Mycobacterium marinum MB2]
MRAPSSPRHRPAAEPWPPARRSPGYPRRVAAYEWSRAQAQCHRETATANRESSTVPGPGDGRRLQRQCRCRMTCRR